LLCDQEVPEVYEEKGTFRGHGKATNDSLPVSVPQCFGSQRFGKIKGGNHEVFGQVGAQV